MNRHPAIPAHHLILSLTSLIVLLALMAAPVAIRAASSPATATVTPTATQQRTDSPGELAADAAALARQAQEAYNAGRYPDAARLYEQLAERAPSDPVVLYDLGTAHASAGQTSLAVWRYLQALELTPRDTDLRYNLRTVAPDIFEQLAVTPLPPINWLYRQFTGNEWTALAGGSGVLALLLGALYFSLTGRPRLRGALRQAALALLVLAVIAWPFALAHFYFESAIWRGVVVAENSVARTGPSVNQIETYPLPMGTVIRIRDESTPGWVKFSYAGGRVGFIERSRIRFL